MIPSFADRTIEPQEALSVAAQDVALLFLAEKRGQLDGLDRIADRARRRPHNWEKASSLRVFRLEFRLEFSETVISRTIDRLLAPGRSRPRFLG